MLHADQLPVQARFEQYSRKGRSTERKDGELERGHNRRRRAGDKQSSHGDENSEDDDRHIDSDDENPKNAYPNDEDEFDPESSEDGSDEARKVKRLFEVDSAVEASRERVVLLEKQLDRQPARSSFRR